MSKLIAGLCCLMLAAPPFALAQVKKETEIKAAPLTARELAEKEQANQKAVHMRLALCSNRARDSGLKANSAEFNQFVGTCLKG